MTKDHGPSIKDDATYEALRKDGASKGKAARIANARANDDMHPSKWAGRRRPTRSGRKTTSTTALGTWTSMAGRT